MRHVLKETCQSVNELVVCRMACWPFSSRDCQPLALLLLWYSVTLCELKDAVVWSLLVVLYL